jgi:hypothetical protein
MEFLSQLPFSKLDKRLIINNLTLMIIDDKILADKKRK